MRILLIILVLGSVAWAQQTTGCFSTDGIHCDKTPAPIKCGKYQHIDTIIDCSEAKNGHVLCPFDDAPTKQTCADDIHPLTEREWQEIMARLKKLEHPSINWGKFCGTTVNGVTITCHQ